MKVIKECFFIYKYSSNIEYNKISLNNKLIMVVLFEFKSVLKYDFIVLVIKITSSYNAVDKFIFFVPL